MLAKLIHGLSWKWTNEIVHLCPFWSFDISISNPSIGPIFHNVFYQEGESLCIIYCKPSVLKILIFHKCLNINS